MSANWNEAEITSSSLSALKLRSFTSFVEQYARVHVFDAYVTRLILTSCVFPGSLRVVCERTHRSQQITGSVNKPKSNNPGTNYVNCVFHIIGVFSGISV